MAKVAVIIPAAGAGERFGGKVKKPFAQIDNRPIFIRSIELFLNRKDVAQVILTVSPDDLDVVKEKYAANIMFMGIKLVKGGATRFESVRAALSAVDEDADLVCIHDAVRPCVLQSWIDKVFEQATTTGAAILAAPLHGTIKRVKEKRIVATVPRAGLFEAQTPQVFERGLLAEAYSKLEKMDKSRISDDAQLVEAMGRKVAVVETDSSNIKITRKIDVAIAEAIIKARPRPKAEGYLGPYGEAQW